MENYLFTAFYTVVVGFVLGILTPVIYRAIKKRRQWPKLKARFLGTNWEALDFNGINPVWGFSSFMTELEDAGWSYIDFHEKWLSLGVKKITGLTVSDQFHDILFNIRKGGIEILRLLNELLLPDIADNTKVNILLCLDQRLHDFNQIHKWNGHSFTGIHLDGRQITEVGFKEFKRKLYAVSAEWRCHQMELAHGEISEDEVQTLIDHINQAGGLKKSGIVADQVKQFLETINAKFMKMVNP